ncbi:MAG: HAD-IA family hydrolase [Hyphomicrobiaceae bacterium]
MQLILFDCDGTLVDSQLVIHTAMSRAFERSAVAPPDRQRALSIVGLSLHEAVRRLLPGGEEGMLQEIANGYKAAASELREDPAFAAPFFPGARETLMTLAGRTDVVLGLATGKSRRGVDRLIATEGLEGVFGVIQTADSAPSKPHPAMILQAMASAGASESQTIMIGDTTFDIDMAREARVTGIGVAWGYHPVDALVQSGADRIVESYADLRSALGVGGEGGA